MPAISQNRRTPHCDAIGKVVYFLNQGAGGRLPFLTFLRHFLLLRNSLFKAENKY